MKNIFAQSHTEHHWRCFKLTKHCEFFLVHQSRQVLSFLEDSEREKPRALTNLSFIAWG
jgi:hypothetical protein